jgi:thioredoxin 1
VEIVRREDAVYINLITKYLIMTALLALSVAGSATAAVDPETNTSLVLELNDSTVNSTVARYPFFILDVTKSTCGPCQRMKAAISELSLELGGQAAFGMIKGIENNITTERYNITTYPTLLIFENGTLVKKSEGFASKGYVLDTLRRLKPGLNTSRVTNG